LEEFTEQFQSNHPGYDIIDRDVYKIPHLEYDESEAGRTPVANQTPELAQAFELASELTTELHQASAIVIATPMFNWGPPSALKAYIDRIINTRNFYTKAESLKGIPITFIVVSGGPYSVDAGVEKNVQLDHLRPLLSYCFSQIGADDIFFVNGDPTMPIQFGKVAENDPNSGMSRARVLIPQAASRVKTAE
jgi:FMN-dependent NADH-azoreductase